MTDMAQPPLQEVTPELRDQARAIFQKWQSGELTYQAAVEQLEQLRVKTEGNSANQGQIELNMGMMQGYRGNYDASIAHFENARECFIQAGNRRLVINSTMNIGETYRLKGNYTRARQYFNAAYEAAVSGGFKSIQVTSRTNEAQTYISQGRYDQAAGMLKACFQLCLEPWEENETDNIRRRRLEQMCEITYAQAWVCLEVNKPEDAWQYAVQSLKYAIEHGTSLMVGMANRMLGEVVTALGRVLEEGYSDNPDEYFAKAVQSFREIKADGEIARTLFAHGKSLGKRGSNAAGAHKLQQATVIFTKLGMMDDAAKAAEAQLKLLR
jgi:tetratricopeptide (TPR) repeat protein